MKRCHRCKGRYIESIVINFEVPKNALCYTCRQKVIPEFIPVNTNQYYMYLRLYHEKYVQ